MSPPRQPSSADGARANEQPTSTMRHTARPATWLPAERPSATTAACADDRIAFTDVTHTASYTEPTQRAPIRDDRRALSIRDRRALSNGDCRVPIRHDRHAPIRWLIDHRQQRFMRGELSNGIHGLGALVSSGDTSCHVLSHSLTSHSVRRSVGLRRRRLGSEAVSAKSALCIPLRIGPGMAYSVALLWAGCGVRGPVGGPVPCCACEA